ncbi:MAG: cytochrome c oxidase assembly protein [Gemmatimonadaceae bacterium]|nr:cytochrome c oxidase assembly protein [Gemmatimonadaceae bacterium]
MQWWCSAQGVAWSWTWRPYVGVWLIVLVMAGWYWWAYRRAGEPARGDRRRVAAASAGVLLTWIAFDWPVGALGAGYLASVHMVQFLLVAMIVPPLLLFGLPRPTLEGLTRRPALERTVRAITQPIVGLVAFDIIVVTTHVPAVVDALMSSQLGSFALEMAWLVSGIAFWWPVVCDIPIRPRFGRPMKMGYLFLGTLAHTGVATYLLYATFPVYRTYELAPPIPGISALGDQEVAGGLMLLVGTVIVLGSISVLFFRWQQEVAPESDATIGAPGRFEAPAPGVQRDA